MRDPNASVSLAPVASVRAAIDWEVAMLSKLAAVALAALVLAGCASDSTSTSSSNARPDELRSSTTAAGPSRGKSDRAARAPKDVGSPSCSDDGSGSVKVTNHADRRSDYKITVGVLAEHGGKQLQSTTVDVKGLEPRASTTVEFRFAKPLAEGETCQLFSIQQSEPA